MSTATEPKKKSRKLWLWIILAIVAVFILAQLAGGGDDVEATASSDPTAQSSEAAAQPTEAPADTGRTVTYEVTSDAVTATSVTFTTMDDGEMGQEQATEATLPLTKEVQIGKAGAFSLDSFGVSAQAGPDATTISCKITVDGEVVAEQTSTGPYAMVMCNS